MRYSFLRAVMMVTVVMFSGFVLPVHAQPESTSIERISAFHADIAVREDGSILVAERIEYSFPTQRHGIFRDLPLRYSLEGKVVRIPIELERVERGGQPTPYTVKDNGNVLRVQIGDPDATITGAQSYLIVYSVRGALRYFEDHDELYWNVTGNGWEVPIDRASALVRAPAGSLGSLTHTCYTGPQGSTEKNCLSRAEGEAVSVVAADALTIVIGWKPGIVAKLLPVSGSLFTPSKLWPLIFPFIAAVLLYRRWSRVGRDPKGQGTTVVQYDPPEGLTPAEVSVLAGRGSSANAIVATIVDLAVLGHVKFVEVETKGLLFTGTRLEIHRVKDGKAKRAPRPHEQAILNVLFSVAPTVSVSTIKEKYLFDGKIEGINKSISDALIEAGYFPKNIHSTPGQYLGWGALTMTIGMVIAFFITEDRTSVFMVLGLAIVIIGIMLAASGKAMVQETEKGVSGREHAEGFKEYLAKAEKYRLQWQEKEGVFEALLPYAMVFGVAEKWTKAFEGFDLKKPDWYEGRSFASQPFNAGVLMGSLSQMQKATASAVMATKPAESSSGSGFSGGSSGGGGGGGGGGSW